MSTYTILLTIALPIFLITLPTATYLAVDHYSKTKRPRTQPEPHVDDQRKIQVLSRLLIPGEDDLVYTRWVDIDREKGSYVLAIDGQITLDESEADAVARMMSGPKR